MHRSRIAITLGTLLVLAVPGVPRAQTDNPAWLSDLERQIAEQKQCDVGFYVFFDEQKIGGRKAQQAKLQCVDGRQFEASRTEPETEFKITECGTQVC